MMKYFKMIVLYVAFYFFGQVIGYNIDLMTARKDIESLIKYLNTKDTKDTDYEDEIFAKLLDTFKEESEKKLLLSQIVPLYLRMLESMKVTELNGSITNLSQMLRLSNEDFLKTSDQKLKSLNDIKNIKMSDIKTQISAVKELLRIMRDVATLQNSKKAKNVKCKREKIRRKRGC